MVVRQHIAPLDGTGGDGTSGYTIDELARKVAMSARNIRAHQARRLLPPPQRCGRTALYTEAHVRRLETIKGLQRRGFNLVAIEAMLDTRGQEQYGEALVSALRRLGTEDPALGLRLVRHGVLTRDDDGALHPLRPRLVRAALELRHAGLPPAAALHVLADVLDRTRRAADELVAVASARTLTLAPAPRGTVSPGEPGAPSPLGPLLAEAFRLCVESAATTTPAARAS